MQASEMAPVRSIRTHAQIRSLSRAMKKILAILTLAVAATAWNVSLTGCAGTRTRESTGEYVDDSAITTKVKTELIRDSSIKSRQIDVTTFKGVVQLSGFVDTKDQKTRAEQIAGSVSGVREVRNNIEVK
jgi:hyperosmotically inducible periplasmic protein